MRYFNIYGDGGLWYKKISEKYWWIYKLEIQIDKEAVEMELKKNKLWSLLMMLHVISIFIKVC